MGDYPYPLPPCRWRVDDIGIAGRVGCRSPIIDAGCFGVVPARCFACTEADHIDQQAEAPHVDRPGDVRHLLMHVYPVGQWRRCLREVERRIALFNGVRCLSFAQGAGTAPRDECEAAVAGWDARTNYPANDPARKELVSYHWLLQQLLAYRSAADAHYYCHSKAVCTSDRPDFDAAWTWGEAMHEALLDYWPAVRRELETHCAVGIFRRGWARPLGTRAQWHYSGAFRWVRNADLFSRKWDQVQDHWLGVEMHVGEMFGRTEAACLYGEFATQDYGLYQRCEWHRWATPQREAWLSAHVADRESPQLATVIVTAHRQRVRVWEAIASVRSQTTPDWQLLVVASPEALAWPEWGLLDGDARTALLPAGDTPAVRARHAGQGWAVNQAMTSGRVRGDVILVLSDDDLLAHTWLEAVLARARQHPAEGAWYGSAIRQSLTVDGRTLQRSPLRTVGDLTPDNSGRCRVDGGQVAVRRSAWVPWPTDLAQAHLLDAAWLEELAARTRVVALPAVALTHRHTPESAFTRG